MSSPDRETRPQTGVIPDPAEQPGSVSRSARPTTILWGVTLVALGVVFLLDQFRVIDRGFIHDWWPLALIAIGLFSRGHVLTAVGSWVLIGKLEPFGLTYSTGWPVILMIIGAGIIFDAFTADGRPRCGAFGPGGDRR